MDKVDELIARVKNIDHWSHLGRGDIKECFTGLVEEYRRLERGMAALALKMTEQEEL